MKYFSSPYYPARLKGEKVTIDVTNSISYGLPPNKNLILDLTSWMDNRGSTSVIDFGAGALRHAIELLRHGYDVTVVEYKAAFDRPHGANRLAEAKRVAKRSGTVFNSLIWPDEFLDSTETYDVALLIYVLQVVPVQKHRTIILDKLAKSLDPNGPRRLYYAGRYGEKKPAARKFNDGWIRGNGQNDRSFYTEWNSAETDKLFAKHGFERGGKFKGTTQSYLYVLDTGIL